MSKPSITALRQRFLELLPARTIDEFARAFFFEGATTEEKIRRIVRGPGVVVGYVPTFGVPLASLRRAAKAVGIDLQGLHGTDEIAEHISSVLCEWEHAHMEGRPLSSVNTSPAEGEDLPEIQQAIWGESERLAQPIAYLKARKSSKTTRLPVAGWNSNLSVNELQGIWLRVDLRRHPTVSVQSEGVLSVEVNPRNDDSRAYLDRGQTFVLRKGEKPLFAEEAWDFPCHEILQLKAKRRIRDLLANDDNALQEYETEWRATVHPMDHLTGTNVYAQLGGWPTTWPEEGAEEQLKKQLVVRTYRDAEPWIEVFRTGRRYEVRVRIT